MIRHFLQRVLVALIRFSAVGFALLLLTEFSFVVVGEAEQHVWSPEAYGVVPEELAPRPLTWEGLLQTRATGTARVLILVIPSVLLIGYSWGLLGARLRRYHTARLLAAPFAAFACVPGFWFVVLVAIYSYFHWQRPGFANDLVVERGPDLLAWWHAAVVALPAMAGGAAWQIRAVAGVLERETARPWVRGLFVAGANDEEIFYGRAIPRAAASLAALLDRPVAAILGSLVGVESAFRYPGLGSLLVESVRLGSYPGILLASLSLAAIVLVATLLRELISPASRE